MSFAPRVGLRKAVTLEQVEKQGVKEGVPGASNGTRERSFVKGEVREGGAVSLWVDLCCVTVCYLSVSMPVFVFLYACMYLCM